MTKPAPNFLAQIAARTVGALPRVEPRLANLYEAEGSEEPSVVEVDDVRESCRPTAGNQAHTVIRHVQAPQAAATPVPAATAPAARALDTTVSNQLRASTPSPPATSPEPRKRRDTDAVPAPIREIETVREILIRETAPAPDPRRQEAGLPPGPSIAPARAEPAPSQLLRPAPAAIPTLPIAPIARPTVRDERPPADRTPEPSVHISIGRIEIRAAPAIAAPPARATAPRAAAQSLDDYLKRRDGQR